MNEIFHWEEVHVKAESIAVVLKDNEKALFMLRFERDIRLNTPL